MTAVLAVALLVNAVFAFSVWPPFIKRIAADPRSVEADGSRTPFYTVHMALITSGLGLGGASAVIGVVGLLSLR